MTEYNCSLTISGKNRYEIMNLHYERWFELFYGYKTPETFDKSMEGLNELRILFSVQSIPDQAAYLLKVERGNSHMVLQILGELKRPILTVKVLPFTQKIVEVPYTLLYDELTKFDFQDIMEKLKRGYGG